MLTRHAVLLAALMLSGLVGLAAWQWLDKQQVDQKMSVTAVADRVGVMTVSGPEPAAASPPQSSQQRSVQRGAGEKPDSSAAPAAIYGNPLSADGDVEEALKLLLAASREDLDAFFLRGEGTLHDTLLDRFSAELGQEEAEFFMRLLSSIADWPTVKAMILERELKTGQDYRELMLTLGLSSGQIAMDDLLAVMDTGLSMPEGALHLLALHGRAEDIAGLALRAPFPDLNARNPVTGNTAVGALIQHYGMTPNPDPAAAVASLRTLVELGIDTRQAGGELDVLSQIILHTRPWNQQAMGAMAAYVVQSGIITEPEQMTLWNLVDTYADEENLRRGFDQYR